MPNTTSYSFGEVILVPFPFTDQTATKKRPAVVISSVEYNKARPDVILMAVTSQVADYSRIGESVVGAIGRELGYLRPQPLSRFSLLSKSP